MPLPTVASPARVPTGRARMTEKLNDRRISGFRRSLRTAGEVSSQAHNALGVTSRGRRRSRGCVAADSGALVTHLTATYGERATCRTSTHHASHQRGAEDAGRVLGELISTPTAVLCCCTGPILCPAAASTPPLPGALVDRMRHNRRVAPGISARGSHRSVRKPLGLYGSCHSVHQTLGTEGTQIQCANIRGNRSTIPRQHRSAFPFARSRLYFLRIQRIR
jgi:hypothetical protein